MSYVHRSETDPKTGITLKIMLDESGIDSPLEDDESVIMAVLHRRYSNPAKARGLTSQEAIEEFAKGNPEWQEFPLFMYEHSNVLYRPSRSSINPFSCPWDSGRAGSIFLKKEDFLGANPPRGKKGEIKYGKEIFPDIESALFKAAEIVCEEYTSWCNGEIYGFVVESQDGEHLDSCWGFIGDPDGYVLEEARGNFQNHIKAEILRLREQAKRDRKAEREQLRREKSFCQLSPF